MVCALTCHSDCGCKAIQGSCQCPLSEIYKAVVPPSLVPGGDIHQKSVFHYSVVGVSVSYLTPAMSSFRAVVFPPVADYLATLRKSCHITDQKDSCAQSESISLCKHVVSKVQFSSSTVSSDPHLSSCYSCELYGSYTTITPYFQLSLPSSLAPLLPDTRVAVMSPCRTANTFIVRTSCPPKPLMACSCTLWSGRNCHSKWIWCCL